jgi:hypothetical protein
VITLRACARTRLELDYLKFLFKYKNKKKKQIKTNVINDNISKNNYKRKLYNYDQLSFQIKLIWTLRTRTRSSKMTIQPSRKRGGFETSKSATVLND